MRELLSKLTRVDYIALVALLRGLYVGYKSGFVQELLRIVAYCLTLFLTLQFHEPVAQQLTLRTPLNESTARVAAFGGLLIGVHIVLWMVRMTLAKVLKLDGGGGTKLFGALLGGARLLVLLSFFFMFIDSTPLKELKTDVHTRSLTGSTISQAAPMLYEFLSGFAPTLGLVKQK